MIHIKGLSTPVTLVARGFATMFFGYHHDAKYTEQKQERTPGNNNLCYHTVITIAKTVIPVDDFPATNIFKATKENHHG